MGLYANPELLKWFIGEYPKHCKKNWIWEKVVSALKNLTKFRLN
jgi:hypothetical protein